MANVTDPLARAVHGTNPQNLIEYITRQRIYDSLYWKEECFGLSASDVATKASELKALGGSHGGNNKPTRFLCLALKLLQIQPEGGIVEEFLQNEDFKYVRALGAFYLRLTGRPAEIYELVEPLYNDFRKLRFREPTGWKITYMDELADELLTADRYCGIALPHIPKRDVLVSAGYLDGPRRSALTPLIEEQAGGDSEIFLEKLASDGNIAAKAAMEERRKRKMEAEKKEKVVFEQSERSLPTEQLKYNDEGHRLDHYESRESRRNRLERDRIYSSRARDDDDRRVNRRYYGDSRGYPDDENYGKSPVCHRGRHSEDDGEKRHRQSKEKRHKEKKSSRGGKKYGSLFKRSSCEDKDNERSKGENPAVGENNTSVFEGSEDFWNEQRVKLGLKPLKD